mmetsp:Transcript_11650/g.32249  ORF Transcript_11650/g.32249 Transcript_11650/m.32249 type:complete len:245 (-) Transcript_11650:134-868(-)
MRGLPEGSPPHQQDVMGLLCASWEKVTAEAIMNCWHKAQLRINQKAATVKAEGKSLYHSPETNVLLREIIGYFRDATRNRNYSSEVVSDAAYEADVIGVLELASDDQGRVRSETELREDFDSWCDLESAKEARDLLSAETNHPVNGGPLSVPQRDDNPEKTDGQQESHSRTTLSSEEIQRCATDILSIASRLMRSQPEYHQVASELMKFPDKLLKAKRASRVGFDSAMNFGDKQTTAQPGVYKV